MTDLIQEALRLREEENRPPSVYAPHVPSPEDAAKGVEAEREYGVPAGAAARMPQYETLLKELNARRKLEKTTHLRRFAEDPVNAALIRDDIDSLSAIEKVGNAFARGALNIGAAGPTMNAAAALRMQEMAALSADEALAKYFPAEDRAALEGRGTPAAQAMIASTEASILAAWKKSRLAATLNPDLSGIARRSIETAGGFRKTARGLRGFEASERIREKLQPAREAEGFRNQLLGALSVFADNPSDTMVFMAETLAESAIPIVAGTGVTVATGNPVLGMATLGAGSGTAEYSGKVEEFVEENGIDLTTEEGVTALLGNPELMAEAHRKGVAKGLTVGAIDALSGGIAGKALAANPLGDILVQSVAQAAMGGGGEALGELAAGDTPNAIDVLLEAMLEFATAPIEVAGVAGRRLGSDAGRAMKAGRTADALTAVDEAAAASKLRERSPEKFRAFLDSLPDDASLNVPADDLNTFWQAKDAGPADYGIDEGIFNDALATGNTVSIPLSVYADKIAGTEDSSWFQEHATFSEDEMSVAEAQRFNEEVQGILEEARAEVEKARQAELEARDIDQKVRDAVYSQLRMAGKSVATAQAESAIWQGHARSMAERSGASPEEIGAALGIRIEGLRTPQQRLRGQLDVAVNTLRARRGESKKARQAREPESLTEFVMGLGGLRDSGGDVAALEGPAGLIAESREDMAQIGAFPTERRGVGLDEAARQAVEAGFFPDFIGNVESADTVEADLVPLLLDALARDIRGETVARPMDVDPNEAALVSLEAEMIRRGLTLDMSNDDIIAALEGETLNQLDLAREGPWRDAEITVETEDGESVQVNAGQAVDLLNQRIEAVRQLLDCVKAG